MTTESPKAYPFSPKDPWYHKYYYDPRKVAFNCGRCSVCKWIDSWEVKDARFAKVCPSHHRYLFDAYSSQGRMDLALAIMDERLNPDNAPKLLDVLYKCNTCGGCDASCKRNQDMEPLRVMLDMRARAVEQGWLLPQHMPVVESLRKEDNTMSGKKADRGKWAEGLGLKDATRERCEVLFHCGCEMSFDPGLWKVARGAVEVLRRSGIEPGILGKDETCCGCKMFDMGYRGEFLKYAQSNLDAWKNAGASTIVTACADGYYAMNRLYPEIGSKFRVIHIVQFMYELLQKGQLELTRPVNLKATWHDPCHLGRRDNDRIYVPGKALMGIYDEPRSLLKSVPGLDFVEMFRIKEYGWCCGTGGGVKEAYPDFSQWTALERLREATAVGAEAIVTACPWCERQFLDTIKENGLPLQVLDLVEVMLMASEGALK
jgi:Fe-S oxidoreductase